MRSFGAPDQFELLWLLIPIALLFAWASWRRRVAMRRIGDASLLRRLSPIGLKRRRVASAALTLAATACIVTALARPRGNPIEQEATASGRDVVFLVDVSRSMLASDVAPNRLERCKIWIRDVLSTLENDRVALVAFAGSASVKCPLTLDRAFFLMQLEDLSPRSVPRGGSMIGDAIRKTTGEVFAEESTRHKDILLFTDGEDQESFPVQAAELAARMNIRIITIGIGSESAGSPVPADRERPNPEFITHNGQRVVSRLMPRALADIAAASAGGAFLNVGTGNVNLDRVYADLAANAPREELVVDKTTVFEELFQGPLLLAFVLLALEVIIRDR